MRRLIIPLLIAFASAAYAQKQPEPPTATAPAATTVTVTDTDSRDTREQFKALLQRNPPELGTILKLDPSLFNNQQYLATYPALAAFVAQHPEVAHNPDFYLASVWTPGDREASTPAHHMWEETMQGMFILTIFSLITFVLTWLIRTLVEQRRWSRLSRVQTEVHSKLLERFTSSEDLLRYIETPSGRRFLESAPIPVESGPRQVSAPIGRILFSLQAGLVVAAAGIGLQWVSSGVDKDAAQPLYALGVVALCVGIGFVASAVVSFIVSRRLKLFEVPEAPSV
ncbi:MAG: hypothetical protein AABO58_19800 [Acidobacteriota bacterium]